MGKDIDQLVINTIRFLSVDQVERARSGHPGMPLGASHIVYLIYDRFLKFNPKNPRWVNRDRFILSAGHASAMLYATLYMFGYDLTLEDLKNFRQLGSKTPGHPESWVTPGVEATTGPLGQGLGNGVGMALAEKYLSSYFNRDGYPVIDHYTYVLCSDGDLMEGVSYEVAALAGHWRLNKLIVVWDSNGISIDGPTSLAWSEDVLRRFEALGWDVYEVGDGYDLDLLEKTLRKARESDRPAFVSVRTRIGYGSPLEDSAKVHGAPLGSENALKTKERFGWPKEEFFVSEKALRYTRRHVDRGKRLEEEWRDMFERYRKEYPDLAREFEKAFNGEWSFDWEEDVPDFKEPLATRKASGKVLNAIAKKVPTMLGGSADLSESNNTVLKDWHDFGRDCYSGRNIHYGVREHAMGTIMNGLAYHGGILPYGGTFLIFSDYMRPPIRLAAMSGLQVIYVFTHDSIGLGEDGPTHQPVEQLQSLRLIPNLVVIRPADANEVKVAWRVALKRKKGPTAIVLTRQSVPVLNREVYPSEDNLERGAYVLCGDEDAEVIIMGSGSEVHVALGVWKLLKERGVSCRVVNFPSVELFQEQDPSYRESVLPSSIKKRVVIEAGVGGCWHRYVGEEGIIVSMESFGKSAPGNILFEHFGFSAERIAEKILKKWFL
ncbi:MAG TPA: transketolase [Aquificaceae bacterium]|nr:transketolase [Aquificaceae bacterium]